MTQDPDGHAPPSDRADDFSNLRALATVLQFLAEVPITSRIASLERDLQGLTKERIGATAGGMDLALLTSAFEARAQIGRLNDLIHAAAIVVALPEVLRDEERIIVRPSLAAGNDPSRPYDLETDQRVAEFKLALWTGADAMRKRLLFKDFVHLAADESGREADLFVVGGRPISFLHTSRSKAAWALDRWEDSRRLFETRFGSLQTSVADFTSGAGAHVKVIDLRPWFQGV